MLELLGDARIDSLRNSLQAWLKKNPPPTVRDDSSLESFERTGREWQKKLASGDWVAVHWPEEYGGKGLSLLEAAVVQEELVRAEAPQLLGLFGLTMVGPVLIRYGTDQQKERFLRPILDASQIWCQGFSEPDAGSDIASLRCAAEKQEGGFILNGQKVWTSFAHIADWCFVLCRTDPKAKRHKGLSYLLVDMRSDGVRTAPLKQITGDDEFNEVFFENVFVPEDCLVGSMGQGWEIAISTLMYERVILTFARQIQSESLLLQQIKALHSLSEAAKERFASMVARLTAIRALMYKHLSSYSEQSPPGPEGSLDKLLWSEAFQELALFVDEQRGMAGAQLDPDSRRALYSLGRTIAAGSSEIQRNIIAQRVLELPKSVW